MPAVKEEAIHLIETLPDTCSWDDIIYELYVKKKIEKGLQAVEDGRLVPHKKVKKNFHM